MSRRPPTKKGGAGNLKRFKSVSSEHQNVDLLEKLTTPCLRGGVQGPAPSKKRGEGDAKNGVERSIILHGERNINMAWQEVSKDVITTIFLDQQTDSVYEDKDGLLVAYYPPNCTEHPLEARIDAEVLDTATKQSPATKLRGYTGMGPRLEPYLPIRPLHQERPKKQRPTDIAKTSCVVTVNKNLWAKVGIEKKLW